jgi:hypothetical protein
LALGIGSWKRGSSVPVGDCQRAFIAAAVADGVDLRADEPAPLTTAGHLAIPEGPGRRILTRIFTALDGDELDLARGRHVALRFDAFLRAGALAFEVDEFQHFTSWRLTSLRSYRADAPLAFDRDDYERLCREWCARADRYRSSKPARGFPTTRRTAQRAYFDAVRDLEMPALGRHPVIRISAVDGDGAGAYRRHRSRIRNAIEDALSG